MGKWKSNDKKYVAIKRRNDAIIELNKLLEKTCGEGEEPHADRSKLTDTEYARMMSLIRLCAENGWY